LTWTGLYSSGDGMEGTAAEGFALPLNEISILRYVVETQINLSGSNWIVLTCKRFSVIFQYFAGSLGGGQGEGAGGGLCLGIGRGIPHRQRPRGTCIEDVSKPR
jgi:hypothetical protein